MSHSGLRMIEGGNTGALAAMRAFGERAGPRRVCADHRGASPTRRVPPADRAGTRMFPARPVSPPPTPSRLGATFTGGCLLALGVAAERGAA